MGDSLIAQMITMENNGPKRIFTFPGTLEYLP